MSNIAITPNSSGTGTISITAPNTNTNRTIALPDVAGNVVTTGDSATVSPTMLSGGHGGLKSIQVFTSTGTYTKPAGISTVKVTVTGAGGAGGGHGAANDYGAGGGAGGTAIKIIDVSSVSTVSVNVGAAGAAAAAGATNGGNGAGSSFGSYATSNGGAGGVHGNFGPVKGGDGGTATGGDINIIGGNGQNGTDNAYVPSGNNYTPSYGIGGSSFWGGGGRGSHYNQGPQAGKAYGSGGGGVGSPAGSFNSGAGAAGVVYIEEYA